jgi:hypothetical protein
VDGEYSASAGGPSDEQSLAYNVARAEREKMAARREAEAQAELAELELEEKRGRLIDRDDRTRGRDQGVLA